MNTTAHKVAKLDIGSQKTARQTLSRRVVRTAVFHLILGSGALLICIPLIWMVTSSLKAPNRIFEVPIQWIPWEFRWQNYVEAWNTAAFGRYFFNSIYVSSAVTVL